MVKDVNTGASGSSPGAVTNVNGTLYFLANDSAHGSELWKSDGTTAGTVIVDDIDPGATSSFPFYLTNLNGTLYFQASHGTNGAELWKSDGTAAGTMMVKDIDPGANSSVPSYGDQRQQRAVLYRLTTARMAMSFGSRTGQPPEPSWSRT